GLVARDRANNNVRFPQLLSKLIQPAKPESAFLGEFLRLIGRTIKDHYIFKIRVDEVAYYVLADFADAEYQYSCLLTGGEVVHHFRSGVRQRGRAIAKYSLLHDPLVCEENGMHQPVKKRAGHVYIRAPLIGVFDLATHLKVSHNLRIQADGHLKKVTDGLVPGKRNEMTLNIVRNAFYDLQSAEQLSP